jgi:CsoR family transcriptional regulator, copper-sensing transcriptional repressor
MDAKTDAASRLRRIAGQVGGIQRMLDEGRSTGEVLMQIAAAQAALQETAKTLLRGHVVQRIAAAIESKDDLERARKIQELIDLFARFCRVGNEEER